MSEGSVFGAIEFFGQHGGDGTPAAVPRPGAARRLRIGLGAPPKPPRDIGEKLFDRRTVFFSLLQGAGVLLILLAVFAVALYRGRGELMRGLSPSGDTQKRPMRDG